MLRQIIKLQSTISWKCVTFFTQAYWTEWPGTRTEPGQAKSYLYSSLVKKKISNFGPDFDSWKCVTFFTHAYWIEWPGTRTEPGQAKSSLYSSLVQKKILNFGPDFDSKYFERIKPETRSNWAFGLNARDLWMDAVLWQRWSPSTPRDEMNASIVHQNSALSMLISHSTYAIAAMGSYNGGFSLFIPTSIATYQSSSNLQRCSIFFD